MLILTRKIGESIMVGDNIRLVVLDIRGRQIRLGIEAPPEIVVLREEIARRLTDENLRAASFNYQEVREALNSLALPGGNGSGIQPPRPESPSVTIDSQTLGRVTVSTDCIITFEWGLPGFPEVHRYALVNNLLKFPFYFLQAVDNPAITFVLTEAAALIPDYRCKNGVSTLQDLRADRVEDLQVLVTLTVPPGRPREMTANLMSPLLINQERGIGKQVVIDKPHYSHQHPILGPNADPKGLRPPRKPSGPSDPE